MLRVCGHDAASESHKMKQLGRVFRDGAGCWAHQDSLAGAPMDRVADLINVIHDLCLVLNAVAYLAGGWVLINQFMALIKCLESGGSCAG